VVRLSVTHTQSATKRACEAGPAMPRQALPWAVTHLLAGTKSPQVRYAVTCILEVQLVCVMRPTCIDHTDRLADTCVAHAEGLTTCLQPDGGGGARLATQRCGRPTLGACVARHTHAQCDGLVSVKNVAEHRIGARYFSLVTAITYKPQSAQTGHK
jgi:hypothetical protein